MNARENILINLGNAKKEIAKRNSSNIVSKAKSVAINEIVRYIHTSIIAGKKHEFLSATVFWKGINKYI